MTTERLTPEQEAELQKALDKDPKLLDRLARQASLEKFMTDFKVDRKTPLKCPVCTVGWDVGVLYQSTTDENRLVCKKCHLELKVEFTGGTTNYINELEAFNKRKREEKKRQSQ